MISLTTIVGVDQQHLEELRCTWPTWRRHRPELLTWPLLLICDGDRSRAHWERELAFVDHPGKRIERWCTPAGDQREKMLNGLVFCAAECVETPYYLKLDTDAVATSGGPWLEPSWFQGDAAGRSPAFVASPWGYTKPADAIDRLDAWADGVEAFASFPPLEIHPQPGSRLVRHRRITGWCFLGQTEFTRRAAESCGGRLPVPSQDTFLWYCAARRREPFLVQHMKRFGWSHVHPRRLRDACRQVLDEAHASGHGGPRPDTPPARGGAPTRMPARAEQLLALLRRLPAWPLRGVEVGVHQGELSQALLAAVSHLHLVLVDPWAESPPGSTYYRSGDSCARLARDQQEANLQATLQATDDARERRIVLRQTSLEAAQQVADATLDFVFLDGDHTSEAVRADLRAWWPKIRPGGILCGHDYGHPRDRRGIWGVSRAVDQFAREHGLEVVIGDATVWHVNKPASAETLRAANRAQPSAEQTDHGVVYVLTGPAHAARLVVSLWSLRRHYDGPVTVITTQPESHEIGRRCAADTRLRVEHREASQVAGRRNASYLTKIEMLRRAPYPVTLLLDADTLVVGQIGELFRLEAEQQFCATQFADWTTAGRIMRRRILPWRDIEGGGVSAEQMAQFVEGALEPRPAINVGVLAIRRDAAVLDDWWRLACAGRETFICDEIALQLLSPHYPHRLLDCRYNCSPIHAADRQDVRVWHFHGEKHLKRAACRQLWLPAYEQAVREDVAGLAQWTPGSDRRLRGFLDSQRREAV